jgi:hypothetical protein
MSVIWCGSSLWQAGGRCRPRRAGWKGREEPLSETKRDYQVSRAKPPVHSRFNNGQSGNRRGPRPKSLPALLVDALHKKVVATIDGERREITQRKAVGTQLDGEPHHKAAAIRGGETSRPRPRVMLPHIPSPSSRASGEARGSGASI